LLSGFFDRVCAEGLFEGDGEDRLEFVEGDRFVAREAGKALECPSLRPNGSAEHGTFDP
jgi:hypothetical protein